MSLPAVLPLPIAARILFRSDAYTRRLVADGLLLASASPKGVYRHSVEQYLGRLITAEDFAAAHVAQEPAQARQRRYYQGQSSVAVA
jgi:hypothetical protein